MRKLNPQKPIHLSENKIRSVFDFVDRVLEYFVFFRWIYFKNRPRTNFFFVRSVAAVAAFGVIYYSIFSSLRLVLLGIDLDPVIFFAIAISVAYWQMTNVYLNKKVACNTTHNQIIHAFGEGNVKTAKLLKNTLALNLLSEGLWAHRSYVYFFASALESALDYANSDDKKIQEVLSGRLEIAEARKILLNYKAYLISVEEEELLKAA